MSLAGVWVGRAAGSSVQFMLEVLLVFVVYTVLLLNTGIAIMYKCVLAIWETAARGICMYVYLVLNPGIVLSPEHWASSLYT